MPSSKRLPINVSVTFTSCKIGGNPSPRIEQPQDLSDLIGPIRVDQFDLLKNRLKEIVLDTSHAFFFHKDARNVYSFDESFFQCGAIYARKNKIKEGVTKSTATNSILALIQSSKDFTDHVLNVSNCVAKRG